MSEDEWQVSSSVAVMIPCLDGHVYDRKLRLFAVAVCRRIQSLIPSAEVLKLIDLSEQYADGNIDYATLLAQVETTEGFPYDEAEWITRTASAVRSASYRASRERFFQTSLYASSLVAKNTGAIVDGPKFRAARGREQSIHCDLLREIIHNPFRPVAFDPRWQTSTAVALAQAIYDDRAFDRLPILADALQDAGCEDTDILSHCRGDGPHVRGCWVVDLVLGKS